MNAETRQQGGAVMATLIALREHTAGKLDFGRVAQVHGSRVLRECSGTSAAMADGLVEAVLDILTSIIRLRSH
jgi:hypothetical protein